MSRIINLPLGNAYKIIAISDIHGHLDIYNNLIDGLKLKDEDHLVIIGDFINKGPDNLGVLRKMMALSKRPNTYVLKGNHESFVEYYVHHKDKFKEMHDFLKQDPYSLVLHDMAKEMNYDLYASEDSEAFRLLLLEHFHEEWHFLKERPLLLETEDFNFVHGGYDPNIDVQANGNQFLKYDYFNEKGPVQLKPVIVGHWPASNLRVDRHINTPYFNDEKKIITIDGGLGVKSSGELNAFIIRKDNDGITYDLKQSNSFDRAVINDAYEFHVEDLTFVNYPHFDVEVIDRGERFTKVKHLHTGNIISVFNSLIHEEGNKASIKTIYINRFFNLKKGDQVEICKRFSDCVHVKSGGEFGWILPEQVG